MTAQVPHLALVNAALAEWANLIREYYAPRDQREMVSNIREVYEPSEVVRTARATNERPDPILAALVRHERAGRMLAVTVHNWLMAESHEVGPRRRYAAVLLWMEQDQWTHEEIGKALKLRKALVAVALALVKTDLAQFVALVVRRKMRA